MFPQSEILPNLDTQKEVVRADEIDEGVCEGISSKQLQEDEGVSSSEDSRWSIASMGREMPDSSGSQMAEQHELVVASDAGLEARPAPAVSQEFKRHLMFQ
ncbi:MAG: hypothetical protein AAGD01_14755 [Acidobacteriota bacterium]